MVKRNFDDPLYKQWRKKIASRDRYRCQMPSCSRGGKNIQVHHIKRWADYPSLRYEETNGISLCYLCHQAVKNNEVHYEPMFSQIIENIYGNNSGH